MNDIVTLPSNGIETFFNDVADYQVSTSNFFNSISHFTNNIINSVRSCVDYFVFLDDFFANIYNELTLQPAVAFAISLSLFFLLLNFVRNRGA